MWWREKVWGVFAQAQSNRFQRSIWLLSFWHTGRVSPSPRVSSLWSQSVTRWMSLSLVHVSLLPLHVSNCPWENSTVTSWRLTPPAYLNLSTTLHKVFMSACAQVRDVCNDCIHILMEKENLILGNIINPTRDVFHLNPLRVKLALASSEQRLDEARWNAVMRGDGNLLWKSWREQRDGSQGRSSYASWRRPCLVSRSQVGCSGLYYPDLYKYVPLCLHMRKLLDGDFLRTCPHHVLTHQCIHTNVSEGCKWITGVLICERVRWSERCEYRSNCHWERDKKMLPCYVWTKRTGLQCGWALKAALGRHRYVSLETPEGAEFYWYLM